MQTDSVEASDFYHCKYCNFKVMSRAELEIHLEATHHTAGLMRPLSAKSIKTPDVIFATKVFRLQMI